MILEFFVMAGLTEQQGYQSLDSVNTKKELVSVFESANASETRSRSYIFCISPDKMSVLWKTGRIFRNYFPCCLCVTVLSKFKYRQKVLFLNHCVCNRYYYRYSLFIMIIHQFHLLIMKLFVLETSCFSSHTPEYIRYPFLHYETIIKLYVFKIYARSVSFIFSIMKCFKMKFNHSNF